MVAFGREGSEFEGGIQRTVEVDPLCLVPVEALQLGVGDFLRTNRSVVEELAGDCGVDDVLHDGLLSRRGGTHGGVIGDTCAAAVPVRRWCVRGCHRCTREGGGASGVGEGDVGGHVAGGLGKGVLGWMGDGIVPLVDKEGGVARFIASWSAPRFATV